MKTKRTLPTFLEGVVYRKVRVQNIRNFSVELLLGNTSLTTETPSTPSPLPYLGKLTRDEQNTLWGKFY